MSAQLAPLSATAEQLLVTAERLLAEKGLGAVSTREIAREAGQKNHSALAYHFGSMDALIEAILDYRMLPLNAERGRLLDAATARGKKPGARTLVGIIVRPFAGELLRPLDESHYINLLAQLTSRGESRVLYAREHRSSAILATSQLLMDPLAAKLGHALAEERLRLMGLHLVSTVAQWHMMHRRGEMTLDEASLAWRVDNFIDYLVGALQAPTSCKGK